MDVQCGPGFAWCEDFEKKANGFKRERSKQSDPLETSSLSFMKKAISYVVTRQNLGGIWLMPF